MKLEDFKGDKRTREYKEFKAKFEAQSKGLGDTVEKITEATGVKKVVKALFGEDCGCDERKAKLNKIVQYKVHNCLEEDEYIYVKDYLDRKTIRVTMQEQKQLLKIYNRVFNQQKQRTSCGSCIKTMTDELKILFNQYD